MASQAPLDSRPLGLQAQTQYSTPTRPPAPFTAPGKFVIFLFVLIPTLGFGFATLLFLDSGVSLVNLGILIAMYCLTVIGIGVGYHRLLAHRSFQARASLRAVLAILGSMAAQGPVLWWVGIHRRHHRYTEQAPDPHSPHLHGKGFAGRWRGLWHAHLSWLFTHEAHDWLDYVPDLAEDSLISGIHRSYYAWVLVGLLLPAGLGGVLTGTWSGAVLGLLWGGLVRIFLVHHITACINSICHTYGTRPFDTGDASRNNGWLALNSFGEAWHNNHHAFPWSPIHGLEWWQLDISGSIIRGFAWAGLAWDLTVPSRQEMEAKTLKPAESRSRDASAGAAGGS